MSSSSSSRLERALELWLQHQQHGGDWPQLLAQHEDLREVLESLQGDPAAAPAADEGRLVGDCRIVREIGRGGVGIVYEALQQSLDRRVALKVLHAPFAQQPAALARFRREARTLARLDHVAIVRVLAVGEDHGQHWLAMDFVDGTSLAEQLEQLRAHGGHRGGSLRQQVEIVASTAEALQHAHAAGVVHRDIKPSNILLRRDGSAVLGDFGLARDAGDPALTHTGVVAGTPHYMAPEQIAGVEPDARSDVFALGATLYECLTLKRAFDGPTTQAVLQRILLRDPPDPRRLHKNLPKDLAAIVMKALEKDPARRYQTAGAFAADLRAFLDLRAVAARPPSRTRLLVRTLRRQPLWAALLLLGVLALGLGATLLLQLPDIHAATAQRQVQQYEDAMTGALLARSRGDREQALRLIGRARQLRPDSGEALAGLCLCLLHFDGAPAALAALDQAGGSADQDVQRMRALLLRRVQRAAEAEALEKGLGEPRTPVSLWLSAVPLLDDAADKAAIGRAREMLSLAVRSAPQPRLLLTVQWAVTIDAQDLAGRREAAAALLALWPDQPLALETAAALLVQVDPQRSVEIGRRALAQDSPSPLSRLNLAAALYRTDDRAAALATAQPCIELPLPGARARAMLALLLHTLGDDVGERRVLERWLHDAPDDPQALRHLAEYEAAHERDAEAEPLLRRAAKVAPDDVDVNYDLAVVLDMQQQGEAAVAQLRRTLQLAPAHQRAHQRLLALLGEQRDAPAIQQELERWVEAVPDDAETWADLARVYLLEEEPGRAEQALAAAERADAIAGGAAAEYLELRAQACEHVGDKAVAAWLRQRAKALPQRPR